VIPRLRATSVLATLSKSRTKPLVMLCEDDEGNQQELIVKLRGAAETKEVALTAEVVGALLADDLDLPVPSSRLVEIPVGFDKAVSQPETAKPIRSSVGLNFGSTKLDPGFNTWPKDKPIPMLMRPLAADILAFDAIIQNPDRRRQNPNVLWKGDDLFIYDHEMAFSFLAGVIDWRPPWDAQGLEFLREHVFYDGLKGTGPNWDRLTGAFEAVSNERLQEYTDAVPNEWKANRDAAVEIMKYLKDARNNVNAIIGVLARLLQ